MSKKEGEFKRALEGKKIPILTLDNTWHRLFTQVESNAEIDSLVEKINELLKKQGKLNTDTKDIRALKKRLLDEIVELMDESSNSKSAEKKIAENKRLVEECNEKLEAYGDDLYEVPRKIQELNYQLMLETMEVCYENIKDNNAEIEEISKWVDIMRVELKKKVVIKQQRLKRNQDFYTYMHNIFGADVIDLFDLKYGVKALTELDVSRMNGASENNKNDQKSS